MPGPRSVELMALHGWYHSFHNAHLFGLEINTMTKIFFNFSGLTMGEDDDCLNGCIQPDNGCLNACIQPEVNKT